MTDQQIVVLRLYQRAIHQPFNNKPQKFTSHGVPSLQGGEEWPCGEQGVATFQASV